MYTKINPSDFDMTEEEVKLRIDKYKNSIRVSNEKKYPVELMNFLPTNAFTSICSSDCLMYIYDFIKLFW